MQRDTASDRLRFAIQFAQSDLNRMRRGDLINLKEDMQEFICPAARVSFSELRGVMAFVSGNRLIDKLSLDECMAIQTEMKGILDVWVRAQSNPEGGSAAPSVKIEGDEIILGFVPGSRCLTVAGPPSPHLFGIILNFLLWNEPANRILRCPVCEKIFYRNRKQQYCSRTCTNRANVQNWRTKQGG
jgi:hypothetical protein